MAEEKKEIVVRATVLASIVWMCVTLIMFYSVARLVHIWINEYERSLVHTTLHNACEINE